MVSPPLVPFSPTTMPVSLIRGKDLLGQPMVMCCLCFGMFYHWQLHKDAEGDLWDVCRDCKRQEDEA